MDTTWLRQPMPHESEATRALREERADAIERVWQLRDARAELARKVIPWWRPSARRRRKQELDALDRQIEEHVDYGLFLNDLVKNAWEIDLLGVKIAALSKSKDPA